MMRKLFVILLVLLCLGMSSSFPTAFSPTPETARPVRQPAIPLAMRHRQQVTQAIQDPVRQPSVSLPDRPASCPPLTSCELVAQLPPRTDLVHMLCRLVL